MPPGKNPNSDIYAAAHETIQSTLLQTPVDPDNLREAFTDYEAAAVNLANDKRSRNRVINELHGILTHIGEVEYEPPMSSDDVAHYAGKLAVISRIMEDANPLQQLMNRSEPPVAPAEPTPVTSLPTKGGKSRA